MPGSGQLIPNGSIHWQISHYDDKGPHDFRADVVPPALAAVSLDAASLTSQGTVGVGSGTLRVINPLYLQGVDPSAFKTIGGGTGNFTITLRFQEQAHALAAIAQAITSLSEYRPDDVNVMWEITLDVPAIPGIEPGQATETPSRYAQVQFDW